MKSKDQPRTIEIVQPKKRPQWHGRRKGLFIPRNPEKYEGDVTNIVYRSGIELRFMKYIDSHPSVQKWSSEETIIPYYSPLDKRMHKYYVDFLATTLQKDGTTKTHLVELKWSSCIVAPKLPKSNRKTMQYMRESRNWIVNNCKWDAAKKVCEKNGWNWLILTEKSLSPSIH